MQYQRRHHHLYHQQDHFYAHQSRLKPAPKDHFYAQQFRPKPAPAPKDFKAKYLLKHYKFRSSSSESSSARRRSETSGRPALPCPWVLCGLQLPRRLRLG